MIRRSLAALGGAAVLAAAPFACAQTAAAPAPNDYANPANWLCRPGAKVNACDTDLTTTVVKADGSMTVEPFKANPKAPIDCFYVYPTVSTDPGVLATMTAEPAEIQVIKQQFARFGASCRLYAPLYRQFTLTGMIAAMTGHPLPGSSPRPITPYTDVRDAWNYYLAHDNNGRGVVLIGHSQGSGILTELIKREIDGKPFEGQLVSAILMGTSLTVAKGSNIGGDFQNIPLCANAQQVACAIAFASFRDTSPPPGNARFGRPREPNDALAAACVNPANLAGGEGALHSYLTTRNEMIAASGQPPVEWVKGKTVTTPFVSVPGLLTAKCVSTPTFNYLSVHIGGDPNGPRAKDINGDVVYGGMVMTDWGLHLIDANLTIGNLVDIVRQEGNAFVRGAP